jgi:hypothetical protein
VFLRNFLPPSSGSESKPGKQPATNKQQAICHLLLAGYFLGLPFNLEDGGSKFLWNVIELLPDYMAT